PLASPSPTIRRAASQSRKMRCSGITAAPPIISRPEIGPYPQQLYSNNRILRRRNQPFDPAQGPINAVEQFPSLLGRVAGRNKHTYGSQVGDYIKGRGQSRRLHKVRTKCDDDRRPVNRPNVNKAELRDRVVDDVAVRRSRAHPKKWRGNRPYFS